VHLLQSAAFAQSHRSFAAIVVACQSHTDSTSRRCGALHTLRSGQATRVLRVVPSLIYMIGVPNSGQLSIFIFVFVFVM
jgi:hypothetical protein